MSKLLNVLTGRNGRKIATSTISAPADLARTREAQIQREWNRLIQSAMTDAERHEIDAIFSRAM
jgi:hypothetical protein